MSSVVVSATAVAAAVADSGGNGPVVSVGAASYPVLVLKSVVLRTEMAKFLAESVEPVQPLFGEYPGIAGADIHPMRKILLMKERQRREKRKQRRGDRVILF